MVSLKNILHNDSDQTNANLGRASYGSIYQSISAFRKSAGKTDDTNGLDVPVPFYFKLFFYFNNSESNFGSNLLGLGYDRSLFTSDPIDGGEEQELNDIPQNETVVNTAYNYLLINNEWERAEKLKKFITLLSNISCYSPWYFSSIQGLDNAIERKEFTEHEFKIDDQRKSIQIKCLPDAYDTRIGTLLDLYRDVCYSYQLNKEIVPENLRKFDMGLYVFSQPIRNISKKQVDLLTDEYASFGNKQSDNEYRTSAKYFEFQGCEIDYNSSKSAYSTLSNAEGTQLEYTINIFFDKCMEQRYNETIMREIGDFTEWDHNYNMAAKESIQKDNVLAKQEFKDRVDHDRSKGMLAEGIKQLSTAAFNKANGLVKRIVDKNLGSLRSVYGNIRNIQSGNVLGGVNGLMTTFGGPSLTTLNTNINNKLGVNNPKFLTITAPKKSEPKKTSLGSLKTKRANSWTVTSL